MIIEEKLEYVIPKNQFIARKEKIYLADVYIELKILLKRKGHTYKIQTRNIILKEQIFVAKKHEQNTTYERIEKAANKHENETLEITKVVLKKELSYVSY